MFAHLQRLDVANPKFLFMDVRKIGCFLKKDDDSWLSMVDVENR